MTREERKAYIKSFYAPAIYGNLENLVDQVYGDHEAQLEEVKFAITVLNKNLELNSELLKAKDEKIQKLNDAYANVVCDFEGAVMEIERLKTRPKINFKDLSKDMWAVTREIRHVKHEKARSIVAMLFWEWKKRNRLYIENKYRNPSANLALYKQANLMQEVFQEAYKILKDTK